MQDYDIFVDAAADIDPAYTHHTPIHFVWMSYTMDEENCICQGPEDESWLKSFYDAQRRGTVTHTSQATPQEYIDAFSASMEKGRDILYLSLSSGLTNTRDSLRLAEPELKELYPDCTIRAVDSLSATGGIGLLAECACENKKKGWSLEANAKDLEAMRSRICHLFMVDDLMYLKRGGRIPAATAVIGTALNIHPILVIDQEGALVITEKKRGEKLSLRELISVFEEVHDPREDHLFVLHTDAPERAGELCNAVRQTAPSARISTCMLTPIIGAHTGPGMTAIVFFGDREKLLKREA